MAAGEVELHVVVRHPNGLAQEMIRRVCWLHAFVHELNACIPAREPHDLAVQRLVVLNSTVDGEDRLRDAPELRDVVTDGVRRHLNE